MSKRTPKTNTATAAPSRRTLADFEAKHGRQRLAALQGALQAQAEQRHPVHLELACADNTLTFGVIGDTHYGSLYEAKDECAAFYDQCRANGVTDVLHAGDVIDGHNLYKGQEFEIHAHGWAQQRDWFAKVAPRVDGITTHFITGNHDASMKKAAGIDVGAELEHVRRDWHCIGEDAARIVFTTPNGRAFRVELVHPDGATQYAISYAAQNLVAGLEGGTKPNLFAVGHYHKALMMPTVRNVATFNTGCFQWQTPFMRRKPRAEAHVGGWIVRVTVQDDKVLSNSVRAEFVAFYGAQA